jgi:type II secretory pathway component PulC
VTLGVGKVAPQPLPKITHVEKRLYDRVVTDNLFSPDRRPSMDEGPSKPVRRPRQSAGLPGFALKGIVITPKGRSALIKFDRERDYRQVVKGEILQGWVLESIEADSVTVKKEGTSAVVKLMTPKSSKPASLGRNKVRPDRLRKTK